MTDQYEQLRITDLKMKQKIVELGIGCKIILSNFTQAQMNLGLRNDLWIKYLDGKAFSEFQYFVQVGTQNSCI